MARWLRLILTCLSSGPWVPFDEPFDGSGWLWCDRKEGDPSEQSHPAPTAHEWSVGVEMDASPL
ncbi:hypothetical protein SCLCIDRAFT_1211279, partial [Scleroderma citrinum Foug A]